MEEDILNYLSTVMFRGTPCTSTGFPTIWETISFSVTVAISTPDEANHPDDQFSLTTVSIKLATFWTDSPEVWFIQAVSQFVIKCQCSLINQ